MADARSLLKAKRLERGAASVPTRTGAGGLRAKEDERLRKGKRKLENTAAGGADVIPPTSPVVEPPSDKRRRIEDPATETETEPASGFPSDFFSDTSRRLPIADDDDEDADADEALNHAPASLPQPKPLQPASHSIDDEFAAFERAIQAASRPKQDVNLGAFSKATISAEAELITEVTDGFPPSVLEQRDGPGNASGGDPVPEEDETGIDVQRKKEEDERELIMDRLIEEERAQEEADAKVTALKARLEAIKLKRAARKRKATPDLNIQ